MNNVKKISDLLKKNSEKEKLYPSCSGGGRITRNFNGYVADNCSIINEALEMTDEE